MTTPHRFPLLAIVLLGTIATCAQNSLAGYTHYWTWKKPPAQSQLEACIADMRKVLVAHPELAKEGFGFDDLPTTFPETAPATLFSDPLPDPRYCLAFNGTTEPNQHEPFVFPADTTGYNQCKTQWKPYDSLVLACLLIARDHFARETLEIQSDGPWEDGAWSGGA